MNIVVMVILLALVLWAAVAAVKGKYSAAALAMFLMVGILGLIMSLDRI